MVYLLSPNSFLGTIGRKWNGLKSDWQVVHFSDQFPHKLARDIALSILIDNGFSAHPENVILSMLAEDDEIIHFQAVEIVLSIRKFRAGKLTPDNANPKGNICSKIYHTRDQCRG